MSNNIVGEFTYFGDTDFESHVSHHYDFCENKLIIGKFCQIAKGVNFIMNGANSTVGSNVPLYTIVAGNPAKEIRKRFDDEMIKILEKLQWWNLDIDEINKLIPLLTCSDLEKAKNKLKTFLVK